MSRRFDVHCDLFAQGSGYEDLMDIAEVEAIAASARPSPGRAEDLLLTPPAYYALANGIADDRSVNDALLGAALRLHALACGVAEPRFGKAALKEIERIAALGAAGIVFSPRAQGVFTADQAMVEACRHTARCGLAVMIRSAPYSINESLARIWTLAEACPEARLVVLGGFVSWENIQLARWNRGGPDNVSYDLSGLSEAHDLAALVADLGAERLMFGSGGSWDCGRVAALVEGCNLAESDRAAILAGNARVVFGTTEKAP
jgi:predicted TIM-barrel fold metal-dependent hydrolase